MYAPLPATSSRPPSPKNTGVLSVWVMLEGGEVCFYPCDEFDAFSFRCLVTSVDSGGGPVVGERDCWLPELGGSFHCFAGCAEAVKDGCVGVDM